MAKALIGYMNSDLRTPQLVAENARLRARVGELEALVLHLSEENDRLGKELAEKACAARGPTRIVLPLRGVSAVDKEGGPFWWPEADAALFDSVRLWTYPPELLREVDAHINDPAFGEAAAAGTGGGAAHG